jgi:hypothetical protein
MTLAGHVARIWRSGMHIRFRWERHKEIDYYEEQNVDER